MSAWGTGIFEDDTACDVRAEYLQLLIDGTPGAEATQAAIEAYQDDSEDEDYAIIFWTALAATQWEAGRLEDSVKDRALRLIERGDSPLWQEQPEHAEARKAVLQDLKNKLNSPPPPPVDKAGLRKLLHEPPCAERPEREGEEQPEGEWADLQRLEQSERAAPGRRWWEFWK